jgi:hypothetical protein
VETEIGSQNGDLFKSEIGSFPFRPNKKGGIPEPRDAPLSFHLLNVYPVRNDAPSQKSQGQSAEKSPETNRWVEKSTCLLITNPED